MIYDKIETHYVYKSKAKNSHNMRYVSRMQYHMGAWVVYYYKGYVNADKQFIKSEEKEFKCSLHAFSGFAHEYVPCKREIGSI